MSRPCIDSPGLDASRCDRQPLRAGATASVSSEGWLPVGDVGMSQGRCRGLRSGRAGAKMLFEFPIFRKYMADDYAEIKSFLNDLGLVKR
jgi:hypothetical protein